MSRNQHTPSTKRDRTRDAVIAALLGGASIREAAAACGVGESTIRGWLRQPAFAQAFREASSGVLDAAVARLQASLIDAAEAIARNLNGGRPSVQIAAAREAFSVVNTQAQLSALAGQLQALEQRLASRQE